MKVKVTIIWYNDEPIIVLYEDYAVYQADIMIPVNSYLIESVWEFPYLIGMKFVITFCKGLAADKLELVKKRVESRIAELMEIEERNKQLDLDLNLEDW